MRPGGPGYGMAMTTTPQEQPEDRPVQAEDLPAEEDVEEADVARQVDEDPEELANYPDAESGEAGPSGEHD
jgi:hypothetical protein